MGTELSRDFIRGRGRGFMQQDWSHVQMTDRDIYKGYPYSAINNKANRVAQLAQNHLVTNAKKSIMTAAKDKEEDVTHPYIDLIDLSTTFDNYKFWYDISTFLDLEGVYYLMVLRNGTGGRIGNIQEFKLLNPYNVRRVRNKDTGEIGGYVEGKLGLVREIPVHMIIEMRKLNPFSEDDPFAVADALRDSQFTLNQSGDFTRHSLKNNQGAPGIITTDVELSPDKFKNFKSRIENHEKGAPIFANGEGKVSWQDMQIDMSKAALRDVNDVSLEGVIATTGNSKTMMGIEQSGVTRDTSRAQVDLFIEQQAMPQLQLIIGALNQDYKTNYPNDYKTNGYNLKIDNPLGRDRTSEQLDVTIKQSKLDLYQALVNKGYEPELAAKYVDGQLDLMDLGKPTNPPVNPLIPMPPNPNDPNTPNPLNPPTPPAIPPKDKKKPTPPPAKKNAHEHDHIDAISNKFDQESQGLLQTQQGALQNVVMSVQSKMVSEVLQRVGKKIKNAFEDQSDIVTQQEKKDNERELELAIAAFFAIIFPLWGKTILNRRASEFQMGATFKLDAETKKYIYAAAQRASVSHVNTLYDELLAEVRRMSLEGASLQTITSSLTKKYSEISKTRAMLIARTETNRAFTMSQYHADLQFIEQNKLGGKAYKRWITTSDNPCELCRAEAAKGPIPFDQAFHELGDIVSVTYNENGKTKVLKQVINYETVDAGNLHPNCGCKYQLVIEN